MGQQGTKFKKNELIEAVKNSYQLRIDSAQAEVERLEAFDRDRARDAWRERCNEIITRLADKVKDGSIQDVDYNSYPFPSKPDGPSTWDLGDARAKVRRLKEQRDRTVTLIPAFTEDKDGNVLLTSYDFKRMGIGGV